MAAQRALMEREPIDLDAHRGSKRAMHIRDGLVDPKHRAAMGDSIWLYLYLHKHAGFKTGIVRHYQHEVAKDELGVCLRTVKAYLSRLEKAGYVTVCRHKTYAEVTITGYFQQPQVPKTPTYSVQDIARYEDDSVQDIAQNDAPESGEVCNILPHSVQHLSRGTTSPLVINKDVPPTAVGGDDPATASESPNDDRDLVAVAWMRADSIDPARATAATVRFYEQQATAVLARGHPAHAIIGCVGEIGRGRRRSGKRWHIKPEYIIERIGRWREPREVALAQESIVATQETLAYCRCGALVGEGGTHQRGCGLSGRVTWDNYVDVWRVHHDSSNPGPGGPPDGPST